MLQDTVVVNIRLFILSVPVLFLSACALSPQIIVIEPDISVQGNSVQPLVLQLEVVDGRDSPILGQRGGIYKETSHISTSENMTTTLRNRHFRNRGTGWQTVLQMRS